MLDKSMQRAIREIAVDARVKQALVDRQGPFASVLETISAYERANWNALSIILIRNNTDTERVSNAYLNSLIWYKGLLDSMKPDDTEKNRISQQPNILPK